MIHDLGHIPLFAGVAALLYVHVPVTGPPLKRVGVVVSICAAMALAVEVVQLVTGTGDFQLQDLWFDLVGTMIGLAVAAVGLRHLRRPALSVLVVIGVVVGLLLLPERDSVADFEYASDAIERRCTMAPTEDVPPAGGDAALASYPIDEGRGRTVSDVEGGLDLTIENPDAVSWATDGGLQFAGDAAGVSSNEPAAELTGAVAATDQVSVEAWFTPAELPQTGPVRLVTISSGPDFGEANVHVGIEGRAISFRVLSDCDFFNATLSDDVLTAGRRTMVVATYRPGTIELFVDGRRVVSADVPKGYLGSWDPEMRLHVGDEASGDRSFTGTIDEVALFDRALSARDVDQRYAAGSAA